MAEAKEKMIAALRRERAGLVAQGKDERVKQVDEQLKLYGFTGNPEAEGQDSGERKVTAQEARKQPPQGRTAKSQQTTD